MNFERHLVEWGPTTESCVNKEVMALKAPACESGRVGESVDLGTVWVEAPWLLAHPIPWAHVPSMEVLAVDAGARSCMPELIVIV